MTTILEKTAGLVAFVRTVESGSFANAGRLIGSSASAVSKSVARLEKRLGVRLLQRSTRTLSLTSEGTSYYERVSSILKIIEDAEDSVQMVETAHGLLRVSLPVFVGRAAIVPLVKDFMARHPLVKLELSLSDRYVDIIREGYDMALRIGELQDSSLMARHLTNLRLVMVASPTYLARRGTPATVEDLHDHACLRYVFAGRPYAWSFANGHSILFDGPLDADDGFSLREAAIAGLGITLLPLFSVSQEVEAGRLVIVLPETAIPTLPVHIVHAFGRQLPVRARLFSDFLVERLTGMDA
jgi:DNA-binding transcriptional LysR family regulator